MRGRGEWVSEANTGGPARRGTAFTDRKAPMPSQSLRGDRALTTQTTPVPTHPLLRHLWDVIEAKRVAGMPTTPELLDGFWEAVNAARTPLLRKMDGHVQATFVFREELRSMAHTDSALHGVSLVWSGSTTGAFYTGPVVDLRLTRMPRSNVWWAEEELPEDFTGLYCFHLATRTGILAEDVHEPWPMSFCDEYNSLPSYEADERYGRNVAMTTGSWSAVAGGVTSTIDVPIDLLDLPRKGARYEDGTYPVWRYDSHRTDNHEHGELPLVVLMAGQFRESVELESILDQGLAAGRLPPSRVWVPGGPFGDSVAWGWRNGCGPGELSAFLCHTLLPAAGAAVVHLLGWAYTTYSAVETAIRMPGKVGSLILIAPDLKSPYVPARERTSRAWDVERAFESLASARPGLVVAIGEPPVRAQSSFAWRDEKAERVAAAANAAGLTVRRFTVSDPNIVAESLAIPAGIGVALGQ